MDYLDDKKLKKEILELQQKVRIHSQIGSVRELFYESIGEIPEHVRGHIH